MSGAAATYRSARFLLADYLVRGEDNDISCPLYADGSLVAPTAAGSSVSVWDATGELVVNAAPVTVVGDVATATVPASAVPASKPFSMGWRVEWSLVVGGAAPVRYRNSAGLVRSRFQPVITDADIFRRESALDPAREDSVSTLTTYQSYIDEALVKLHGRLVSEGSLPHLIMEATALREVHLLLALHLICNDFRTRLSEVWTDKASEYKEEFKAEWGRLRFEYDTDGDGKSDGRKKRSASSTIWLTSR